MKVKKSKAKSKNSSSEKSKKAEADKGGKVASEKQKGPQQKKVKSKEKISVISKEKTKVKEAKNNKNVKSNSEEKSGEKSGEKKVELKAKKGSFDLVIVESPTKAKTIKKYLGRGYQVIASNGHIKDLPKSKLGVDVKDNFFPHIVPISGKKSVLEKIHTFSSKAKNIYLGPDPDREGEAIAFHLAEEIGRSNNIYRVLFNAVTKPAVLEAIAHPAQLDQKKYDSQKARRVLDRLVGYKISPILWDKVQRGLSAGRVQSVALRMIVEKEENIKSFKSEQWFSIHAHLNKDGKNFEAKYYGESRDKKTDLLEQKLVETILKDTQGKALKVVEIKKREMRQKPTPPFTTSKLQQEAANKLGFSAKKTMMIAQKLYEGIDISNYGLTGLITYMRTDSVRTDPLATNQLREYIGQKYGKDYLPGEVIIYKKKGVGKVQDAHEAIRPTSLEYHPFDIKNDLPSDEYKLYELIWNKFVSSQMTNSIVDQTAVIFSAGEPREHFFKATGSIVKFPGFRKVFLETIEEKVSKRGGNEEEESEDGDEGPSNTLLPELSEGDKLKPTKGPFSQEHWTSPPPRYNDASIVKDLEERGIGRPSTYASIISNIVEKGYVEKIENRYLPTELGNVVCKMLQESFPNIMDVAFTAKIEERLDLIEEGEVKWTKVLKDFWGPFEKSLETAKEEMKNLKKTEIPTGVKCRKCQSGEYIIKWGRNGQFFACKNYPECTSTEDFKKHLDGSYEIIPKVYTKDPCPTCGKRLIVKKGRYGRFFACEEYPICKTALPYTLDIHCPECKKGKFAEKKSRYGKIFYGCSSYPECQNAMWNLPKEFPCKSCGYSVTGLKESKKKGVHLQCPKCHFSVSIEETPFAEKTTVQG